MRIKKAMCLLMIFCMLPSFALPTIADSPVQVCINGEPVPFDVPPVLEQGRTLIPLRAVFEKLGCDVYWMESLEIIIIVKNDVKLLMRVGYTDFYKFTGYDFERFKQQEDTEHDMFDVPPLIIDGRTLVPIRMVCEAMGVTVNWDEGSKTVSLTCDDSFLADVNQDKDFGDQAIAFFEQITTAGDNVSYEEGNLTLLAELGVISMEDLNKNSYISNADALKTLHKAMGFDPEQPPDLREWYRGTTLEPLDYLDDAFKGVLLDLRYNGRNQVVTYDDILHMDFDKAITEYEALVYITRMIGDTYSCMDVPEELDFTEKSQTYQAAYEKGIIANTDMAGADLPILCTDFYDMVHKAIFVEVDIGGYTPTTGRYVDTLINNMKEKDTPPQEEVIVNTHAISAEPVLHDDMSITWVLPDGITEEDWTDIALVTSDGTVINRASTTQAVTHIGATEIIDYITYAYPTKLDAIRCTYYQYEADATVREAYSFDIDISSITMQIEGDEITPGVYTHFQNQWVPERISLAEGQLFKNGAYYLLTSYEHAYRIPDYNLTSRVVFRAYETSNTLSELYKTDNGIPRFISGGVYMEDMHIQEVRVTGVPDTGFLLSVTPESTGIFKVEEGSVRTTY